jgi:arginyl-tRNA synthetase
MANHEAEIRQLVVDWESGDTENRQLWKHVLDYSYAGMRKTLERLGSSWDKVWYESDHYQEGKDLVEEGLHKGIFQKLEDSAVLTKLESYNIPDTILQKRDGTSLYITQDLALTKKKKLENKVDKLVWVVGPDQSLAMRQVFACCEQLGIGKLEDFWHISYGYVGLADKDGNFTKMSSRKGNVLLIDDLLDTVKEKVQENLKSEEVEDGRSEKLALAAVKFALLKSGKDESLTFDINNSVDVKGDTGIYIMYTLARIHSILEKAGGAPISMAEGPILDLLIEKTGLPRTLLFYPSAVEKSFADKSTHHVAQYLLELAGAFNNFYEQEKIIDEEDTEKVKLAILQATENTILHALQILNIEPVFKI